MGVAAVGPIAEALDAFRNMIAESARFRTWAGVSDQTTARNRIHRGGLPKPRTGDTLTVAELKAYRPFCLLWTDEESGFRASSESTHGYLMSGSVNALFEFAVPAAIRDDQAELDARTLNDIGVILDEIFDLSQSIEAGGVQFPRVNEIVFRGPFRTHFEDRETAGDAVWCLLRMNWGAAS